MSFSWSAWHNLSWFLAFSQYLYSECWAELIVVNLRLWFVCSETAGSFRSRAIPKGKRARFDLVNVPIDTRDWRWHWILRLCGNNDIECNELISNGSTWVDVMAPHWMGVHLVGELLAECRVVELGAAVAFPGWIGATHKDYADGATFNLSAIGFITCLPCFEATCSPCKCVSAKANVHNDMLTG